MRGAGPSVPDIAFLLTPTSQAFKSAWDNPACRRFSLPPALVLMWFRWGSVQVTLVTNQINLLRWVLIQGRRLRWIRANWPLRPCLWKAPVDPAADSFPNCPASCL